MFSERLANAPASPISPAVWACSTAATVYFPSGGSSGIDLGAACSERFGSEQRSTVSSAPPFSAKPIVQLRDSPLDGIRLPQYA